MVIIMKKHITKEDVAQLTYAQRQRLSEIWLPEKYDLAVAYICTNAETEEYEQLEYVVGDIKLYHTHFILYDLKYLDSTKKTEEPDPEDFEEETSLEEGESLDNESGYQEESDDLYDEEYGDNDEDDWDDELVEADEGFDFAYVRPTTFSKEDCVPLMDIGQMIEILSKNSSKSFDFYLLADSGEKGVELGSNNFNLSGYGSEFESQELCDVLWECVKSILI